ncbi:MAG: hypothetical protein AB2807_01550 [Candidatus Sedimenticola endophacoides]
MILVEDHPDPALREIEQVALDQHLQFTAAPWGQLVQQQVAFALADFENGGVARMVESLEAGAHQGVGLGGLVEQGADPGAQGDEVAPFVGGRFACLGSAEEGSEHGAARSFGGGIHLGQWVGVGAIALLAPGAVGVAFAAPSAEDADRLTGVPLAKGDDTAVDAVLPPDLLKPLLQSV